MYFLQNWARILIWIVMDLIKNYPHMIYKTDRQHYFPFKHICVHNLSRFSDTGIIMASQRRCYARDLPNHAQIFYNVWFATWFRTLLANFGFVMYQNQTIHVIIGFKHCEIGGTQGPLGYVTALTDPRGPFVPPTDPRGHFAPPISQCTIHNA